VKAVVTIKFTKSKGPERKTIAEVYSPLGTKMLAAPVTKRKLRSLLRKIFGKEAEIESTGDELRIGLDNGLWFSDMDYIVIATALLGCLGPEKEQDILRILAIQSMVSAMCWRGYIKDHYTRSGWEGVCKVVKAMITAYS